MKKFLTLMVALAILTLTTLANATLIGFTNDGYPDIFSDTTGVYNYNASSDLINFSAKALTITFESGDMYNIMSGGYTCSFYIDENGNYTHGIPGDDLRISGAIDVNGDGTPEYNGVLLTGNITQFGYEYVCPTFSLFDYTFDVTGGALASLYGASGYDTSSIEVTNFCGDWHKNSIGLKVKHDTAPLHTPIPPTAMLISLALGLCCLATKGKKHHM